MTQRFIVVSGGVISGVGKGVATASIGKILQQYGFSAIAIKIDPYLNFDAGTLRPTEHGEVWVTDDGGEIDQDLGNYERFLGISIPKKNNITTGQIYKSIIDKERQGFYLGKTVQPIPHITEEIKSRIKEAGGDYEFILVEIGGTIGDYENVPFLFALKSLERELGSENFIHILITYLPIPRHINEMKTKPTQQAIRMLGEHGIFPDFVLCRARKSLDEIRKKKIELYANIDSDHIISAPDVDNIYEIPLNFEKEGLGIKILDKFKLAPKKNPDWSKWKELVEKINKPKDVVNVALVCKYIDIGDFELSDSYVSVNQALKHAGAAHNVKVNISWIDSKIFEKDPSKLNALDNFDGIVVPGGFGSSGVEGKISAINYARINNIPFLGLCFGLQLAVIEFARNVCGLENANTSEVDPNTPNPVIDIIESQKNILNEKRYGASMRLGAYAALLKEGTKVLDLYKKTERLYKDLNSLDEIRNKESFRIGSISGGNIVLERHRHRYEVNPSYIETLEKNGLIFSGHHVTNEGTRLMEFIELSQHKNFLATQSHPEFKSRLEDPSPLFYGFIEACKL